MSKCNQYNSIVTYERSRMNKKAHIFSKSDKIHNFQIIILPNHAVNHCCQISELKWNIISIFYLFLCWFIIDMVLLTKNPNKNRHMVKKKPNRIWCKMSEFSGKKRICAKISTLSYKFTKFVHFYNSGKCWKITQFVNSTFLLIWHSHACIVKINTLYHHKFAISSSLILEKPSCQLAGSCADLTIQKLIGKALIKYRKGPIHMEHS